MRATLIQNKVYLFYIVLTGFVDITREKINMSLELHDGRITGSSGVAKAGLTLGIIGTGLAALGNNGGFGLGGIFGGKNVAEAEQSKIAKLQADIAKLESERYTDYVGIDLYKNLIAEVRGEDKKISDLQGTMFAYLFDLDKKTALNAQAQELNRAYDTAARDYMFTILNNKIDCCCEKAAMQAGFDRQIAENNVASVIAYVNSTFIPGTLKLPITSICPEPATSTTTA
jgi:hypothetical protein